VPELPHHFRKTCGGSPRGALVERDFRNSAEVPPSTPAPLPHRASGIEPKSTALNGEASRGSGPTMSLAELSGMRIQSSHHHAERGLDAYLSPPEATAALLAIEHGRLPQHLWEPAAGDGAIVRPLRVAHFDVVASDLVDYSGAEIKAGVNYLPHRYRLASPALSRTRRTSSRSSSLARRLMRFPYLALHWPSTRKQLTLFHDVPPEKFVKKIG
jgi:hypothetical protein